MQFKWRNHDPALGRFFNVDPLAAQYVYNSPYAFSENQVTAHVELEGLEKVSIHKESFKNKAVKDAFDVQRQTSGGKSFMKKVLSQKEYNVLYYKIESGASGRLNPISSLKDFQKLKSRGQLKNLSEKAIKEAMEDKKLLLIGISESSNENNLYKIRDSAEFSGPQA